MSEIGKRLRGAREAAKLSQAALARHLKITRNAISLWESGQSRPSSGRIADIARLLNVTADWLWAGDGKPDLSTEFPLDPAFPIPNKGFPPTRLGSSVKDLPVYGAAEGGGGVMVLDNEPIEYVERPVELQGVKGAYAVYVVNESMCPAFEPGDRVHIHPHKPLKPNKDTLFIREEPDGTRYAMIKRLIRATPTAWKVMQFNPERPLDLPRKTWQRAYRIVGSTRAD